MTILFILFELIVQLCVIYMYLYMYNFLVNVILMFIFQDRSIVVWDMQFFIEINLRRVLVGYRVVVNVVDFDEKYIVFVLGDRIIKVIIQFKEISFLFIMYILMKFFS